MINQLSWIIAFCNAGRVKQKIKDKIAKMELHVDLFYSCPKNPYK